MAARFSCRLTSILALFVVGHAAFLASSRAEDEPVDLELGERLYVGNCAHCHGMDGSGGRGPSLQRPTYDRAPTDSALRRLIRGGIRTGEMPASWWLSSTETEELVHFLRSIGDTPREELPGNPKRGERVYAEQDCASCHIINGKGSGYGPELTSVGSRRSAEYLRESLIRPGAKAPENFAMVFARMNGGAVVEGIRLNEDAFTVQIRDVNRRIHSVRKADLEALRTQPRRSPMPSYGGKLTSQELDDLVAYMAALRGGK